MAKRSPLKVLLFLILLLVVAYLCKRGWEEFYVTNPSPGVYVSSQFNQLVNGDWYAWDVPIPSTDGTYNCVADAGDGRTISWTCIVSGGTYDVPGSHAYNSPASSGFTTTGDIGSGLTFFPSITYTPGGPAGTHPDIYVSSNPSTYPNSYPNNFRPAYFGIGFWYRAGGAGGYYVLTVTQTNPPPAAARAAAVQAAPSPVCPDMSAYTLSSRCNACAAPNACVDMTPYMLKAKCLLTDDDQNPGYMLIEDCPTCKEHRQS